MSKSHDPYWINKKKLLPEEYQAYKVIGTPDMSQNWLEIFTPTIIGDLFTIMNSCSNNQQKAEYIRDELLKYYGFEERGLGTNVYTMSNPAYPGVVFKFALDDCGLADNFNDEILQDVVPHYTRTLMRHPSGIVSVQERKVPIRDQARMASFRGDILKTLGKLARDYLIIDLSPNMHLNYCVERDGSWGFIDASDLYPLDHIKDKIRCNKAIGWDEKKRKTIRCHGQLQYDPEYERVYCTKCGSEFLPSEIRPNDKEDVAAMANSMLDGFTAEEREKMRQEEMRVVMERMRRKAMQKQTNYVYGATSEAPKTSVWDQLILSRKATGKPIPTEDEIDEFIDKTEGQAAQVPPGNRNIVISGGSGIMYNTDPKVSIFAEPDDDIDEMADEWERDNSDEDYDDEDGDEVPSEPVVVQETVRKTEEKKSTKIIFGSADSVKPPTVTEPTPEQVREATVKFDDTSAVAVVYGRDATIPVENDDDEDEEDEYSQEPFRLGINYNIQRPFGPDDDGALHIDFRTNDPVKAWSDFGIAIYISLDGGKTTHLAIPSDALFRILSSTIKDAQEELNDTRS